MKVKVFIQLLVIGMCTLHSKSLNRRIHCQLKENNSTVTLAIRKCPCEGY